MGLGTRPSVGPGVPTDSVHLANKALDGLRDPCAVKTVLRKQVECGTGLAKDIVDAYLLDGGGAGLAQQIAHGTSQATDHGVLLDGDDASGLSRRGHDKIPVKRLDRCHVDDLAAHTLVGKRLGRLERGGNLKPACDHGDVRALALDDAPAKLEVVVTGPYTHPTLPTNA